MVHRRDQMAKASLCLRKPHRHSEVLSVEQYQGMQTAAWLEVEGAKPRTALSTAHPSRIYQSATTPSRAPSLMVTVVEVVNQTGHQVEVAETQGFSSRPEAATPRSILVKTRDL